MHTVVLTFWALAVLLQGAAACQLDNVSDTTCGEYGSCGSGKDEDGKTVPSCFCQDGYMLRKGTPSCIKEPGPFAVYKSLCLLGLLLLVGKSMRMLLPPLQKTFMPAAIIAGLLFFCVLQGLQNFDEELHLSFTHEYTAGWSKIGPFAVDVLFASLFLGTEIPSVSTIVQKAGPQFIYNQLLNWGLWIVSALIVGAICTPLFGSNALLATLIPAGFTGGHAVIFALQENFEELGYAEGVSLGLYVATLGQVMSFILGVWWINMAAARDMLSARPKHDDLSDEAEAKIFAQGLFPENQVPSAGKMTISPDSMDVLSFHGGVVFVAMFIGVSVWESTREFFKSIGFEIQRFVWCMLIGIIFQIIYEKLVSRKCLPPILDSAIMSRLQGFVLDFLIVSAMSTVDLEPVLPQLIPVTLACVTGLAWLGFCTWFLAKHFLPDYWFERAICEYGQTTGVISSGLILLKMCDPKQKLPVMDSFALKNFAAMPFMFTFLPASLPITAANDGLGLWVLLIISVCVLAFFVAIWYFYYRPLFARMQVDGVEAIELTDEGATPKVRSERFSRASISFA